MALGHWAVEYLGEAGAGQGGSGSGGGGLVVREKSYDETEQVITYDKTWQEVNDAISAGVLVTMIPAFPSAGVAPFYCTSVGVQDGVYEARFTMIASDFPSFKLSADSPDDYLDDGDHGGK